MRRILSGLAAAALVIGLAGCDRGGEQQAPAEKTQPAAEQTAPASEQTAPAETGEQAAPTAEGEQAPAAEDAGGDSGTAQQPAGDSQPDNQGGSQPDSEGGEGH